MIDPLKNTFTTAPSPADFTGNLIQQVKKTMELLKDLPPPFLAYVMSAEVASKLPRGDVDPDHPFNPLFATRVLVWHDADELREIMKSKNPDARKFMYLYGNEGERFVIESENADRMMSIESMINKGWNNVWDHP